MRMIVKLCGTVLLTLAIAACGREAPPRAAATIAPTSARIRPTLAPAPTLDAAAGIPTLRQAQGEPEGGALEQRALGDPNAPITVIEYGDYQ